MPIKCAICNEEFNLIHHSHLKKHNITRDEYKEKYGEDSLICREYKEKRKKLVAGKNNPNYGKRWTQEQKDTQSTRLKGKVPWNKGVKTGSTKNLRNAIEHREEKYKSGELQRAHAPLSKETKQKISASIKQYAVDNPDEMKQRAKKAVETKRSKGPIIGNMTGKTHTEEAKRKIADAAKKANDRKTQQSLTEYHKRIQKDNLVLLSVDNNTANLECTACNNKISVTRQYLTKGKYHNKLCRVCHPIETHNSQVERDIYEFVCSNTEFDVIRNDRSVLNGKELDIWIPSLNLAIEVNGIYWHSDQLLTSIGQNPKKDFKKYKACVSLGIELVTVYDSEWLTKQRLVKDRLLNKLGKSLKIYGRNTVVSELSAKEANQFLRENHLQSSGRSNVRLGLKCKTTGELFSVMTFSKNNISRRQLAGIWEINRFCSLSGSVVVGGAQKLYKHFVKTYCPKTIISYSDNRWGTGKVYSMALGMTKEHAGTPNYWYFATNSYLLEHRFKHRKNQNDPKALTEWDCRQLQGLNRIWDCGHTKFVFKYD